MSHSGELLAGDRGRRLEALLSALPAAVVVLSGPDHVFDFVNARYMEIIGRDRVVRGLPVREAMPELAGQGFIELLDTVFATGEPFYGNEMLVRLDRNRDGVLEDLYFNFVYLPTHNDEGDIDGILAHGVEVTGMVSARLRVEQLVRDLEVQRASLETVIERMPAGVVLCDSSGTITHANNIWREFFRVPIGGLQDVDSWAVFKGSRSDGSAYEPQEYPLARSILEGEVVHGERIVFQEEGERARSIEVSSAPIYDDNGTLASGVAVFFDVTEREQLEREVEARKEEKERQRAREAESSRRKAFEINDTVVQRLAVADLAFGMGRTEEAAAAVREALAVAKHVINEWASEGDADLRRSAPAGPEGSAT